MKPSQWEYNGYRMKISSTKNGDQVSVLFVYTNLVNKKQYIIESGRLDRTPKNEKKLLQQVMDSDWVIKEQGLDVEDMRKAFYDETGNKHQHFNNIQLDF